MLANLRLILHMEIHVSNQRASLFGRTVSGLYWLASPLAGRRLRLYPLTIKRNDAIMSKAEQPGPTYLFKLSQPGPV